jgi:DNA repair exonuclease SbcCD nuclease subunit
MFDSIFDVAYDNNIQTVVVAGDIFEDPDTTTQAERDMVERKLLEYDSAGFRILMIPGNHDLVNATGYTAIHYLCMLSTYGKFRNSCVTENTVYVQVDDTVFCLLCHRKRKFKEDSAAAVAQFRESSMVVPHSHFVVVAHETIRGAQTDICDGRTSSGYYELEKGEDAPDASLPVTYWALGDIHKPQEVSKNAYYSGSPLQTKFGDLWPKGVLVVDTEAPEEPRFVPIPSNQFVTAKKGDIIPPNAYVKWKFDSKDEIPDVLPENVVKVSISADESALSLDIIDGSLRDKLLEGVKQQGASPEELALAETEVASLLEISLLSGASDG